MRTSSWQAMWVEDMPEVMESDKVYISTKHSLTEHLCACGCGAEVSLPLARSEWRIVYDGDTVSIRPSIGNWRLPCKSHYLILENRTIWCASWTAEEISAGRKEDRTERQRDMRRRRAERSWWRQALKKVGIRL